MYVKKKTPNWREAFTLVELLVAIAIILAISALGAALAPRVSDSNNLTRAVDNLEQWLLTAKMRAKRDGLATGVRFIQAQGDIAGTYSQLQYIQQPDALAGGSFVFVATGGIPPPGSIVSQTIASGSVYLSGGLLASASGAVGGASGTVTLSNVDITMGGNLPATQYLILPGDYMEVRDSGVFYISAASSTLTTPPVTTVTLSSTSGYDAALNSITTSTTNYRIFRQPRILIGEEPLTLPNNFAIDMRTIGYVNPGTIQTINYQTPAGWNQPIPPPPLPIITYYYDIVFSPTGAVIGANSSNGITAFMVYDLTMNPYDPNRVGIVSVKSRTGFIGAYSVAPGADPFAFAESGQESGL